MKAIIVRALSSEAYGVSIENLPLVGLVFINLSCWPKCSYGTTQVVAQTKGYIQVTECGMRVSGALWRTASSPFVEYRDVQLAHTWRPYPYVVVSLMQENSLYRLPKLKYGCPNCHETFTYKLSCLLTMLGQLCHKPYGSGQPISDLT